MSFNKKSYSSLNSNFVQIPNAIFRLKLKPQDVGIYAFLVSNSETYHPALKDIAKKFGISVNTVRKILDRLCEVGLIEKTRQGGMFKGVPTNDQYRLIDPAMLEDMAKGMSEPESNPDAAPVSRSAAVAETDTARVKTCNRAVSNPDTGPVSESDTLQDGSQKKEKTTDKTGASVSQSLAPEARGGEQAKPTQLAGTVSSGTQALSAKGAAGLPAWTSVGQKLSQMLRGKTYLKDLPSFLSQVFREIPDEETLGIEAYRQWAEAILRKAFREGMVCQKCKNCDSGAPCVYVWGGKRYGQVNEIIDNAYGKYVLPRYKARLSRLIGRSNFSLQEDEPDWEVTTGYSDTPVAAQDTPRSPSASAPQKAPDLVHEVPKTDERPSVKIHTDSSRWITKADGYYVEPYGLWTRLGEPVLLKVAELDGMHIALPEKVYAGDKIFQLLPDGSYEEYSPPESDDVRDDDFEVQEDSEFVRFEEVYNCLDDGTDVIEVFGIRADGSLVPLPNRTRPAMSSQEKQAQAAVLRQCIPSLSEVHKVTDEELEEVERHLAAEKVKANREYEERERARQARSDLESLQEGTLSKEEYARRERARNEPVFDPGKETSQECMERLKEWERKHPAPRAC